MTNRSFPQLRRSAQNVARQTRMLFAGMAHIGTSAMLASGHGALTPWRAIIARQAVMDNRRTILLSILVFHAVLAFIVAVGIAVAFHLAKKGP